MSDRIKYEILDDGTISITTDAVSGQNHKSADELLDEIESVMGGQRVTKARPGHEGHARLHAHGGKVHSHQHHHH